MYEDTGYNGFRNSGLSRLAGIAYRTVTHDDAPEPVGEQPGAEDAEPVVNGNLRAF